MNGFGITASTGGCNIPSGDLGHAEVSKEAEPKPQLVFVTGWGAQLDDKEMRTGG